MTRRIKVDGNRKFWREVAAHRDRAEQRQIARADAADNHICTCGWITALDVCPNCDGARTSAANH